MTPVADGMAESDNRENAGHFNPFGIHLFDLIKEICSVCCHPEYPDGSKISK
jgi:hypothetical protein